ncbi:MAG: DUF929 family protein [Candidatus Dormibacter sp.]
MSKADRRRPQRQAAPGRTGSRPGGRPAEPERLAPRRVPSTPRGAKRSIWSSPLPIVLALLALGLLVTGFVVYARNQAGGQPQAQESGDGSSVVAKLSGVSPALLDRVGAGGTKSVSKAITGPPLTGIGGKPQILYLGAEYCPYCAAERWSLAVALSRFGQLQGIRLTRSGSDDAFPDTATLSFTQVRYVSSYIEFVAVETADRQRQPLQSPSPAQQHLLDTYSGGSIPFLDFAGQRTQIGSGFLPDVLANRSQDQIANSITAGDGPLAQAVLGHANVLTAAICRTTAGQPAGVCGSAGVKAGDLQLR